MEGTWSTSEVVAIIGLALAVLIQIVISLRFLYKMDAQIQSIDKSLQRLQQEVDAFHRDFTQRVDRLSVRGEETLILKTQVGGLLERVDRLEHRGRGRA